MNWGNLDMIVKRTLLERGLPIHYYPEFLFHASACLRDLTKDTLKIVNYARLPVNSYFAVDLPGDFVDDVGVFVPAGAVLQAIPKNDAINPLRINDTDGNFTTYTQAASDDESADVYWGGVGWFWYWNISDYGEPTGRFFGVGGGAKMNGYRLLKERRQIQLTETFTSDEVVLAYVSNGQSADAATHVDWMAFSCIQAFIAWKSSPNRDMKDAPEARTYYNEKRLLRANLNDLTIVDIKNIIRREFRASPKN